MARERESNFELLRCISLFLILVIHANLVSLPKIEYDQLASGSLMPAVRFFIESIGIVAVNVFVFISGWFGLEPRKKKVLSLLFQVLWYAIGIYLIFIVSGHASLTKYGVADAFHLTTRDWFVKSYFVLMILSPVLNAFSRNAEEKTQRYVALAFFLFEAVYGWLMGGKRFFVGGYGPLHFIGLYIIAQYIHKQLDSPTAPVFVKRICRLPKLADIGLFFLFAIINTVIVIVVTLRSGDVQKVSGLVYAYSNPLIILGALYLLLFFSKLEMKRNKVINWMGASGFAVYLIHSQTNIFEQVFTPQLLYLYGNTSGIACIGSIFLFLCMVFVVSILIDQLRILAWKGLCRLVKL